MLHKTPAISSKNVTSSIVRKVCDLPLLLQKAERRGETSVEFPDSKTSPRRADGPLILFLKVAETVTPAGYRTTSYLIAVLSGTESLSWPCLGSPRFGVLHHSERPVSTLSGLRSHVPWAKRGSSKRGSFSLSDSVKTLTFLKLSLRPLCSFARARGSSDAA